MSLEEVRKIIKSWLVSGEPITTEWITALSICLNLINEKINADNNNK